MTERIAGTVKWFNKSKGYGFFTYDNDQDDIFVHYSAIQTKGFRYLEEGDQVEFVIEETTKGLQASDVKKIAAK